MADARVQELLRELRERWGVQVIPVPSKDVVRSADTLRRIVAEDYVRNSSLWDPSNAALVLQDWLEAFKTLRPDSCPNDFRADAVLDSHLVYHEGGTVEASLGPLSIDFEAARRCGWTEETMHRVYLAISELSRRETRLAAEARGWTKTCEQCEQWCHPIDGCEPCRQSAITWKERFTCATHGTLDHSHIEHPSCPFNDLTPLGACRCVCVTCAYERGEPVPGP